MEAKFTRGPWRVGGPNGMLNQVSIEPSIGVAYGAGEELVANANIMAASPLLYEALKQQLVMLGMVVNAIEAGESVNPTIEAATILIGDALRAARGEK